MGQSSSDPVKCHGAVLDSFHKSHLGIIRMKALGRNSVTMVPGIDDDLQKHVKSCEPCQLNRNDPPLTPLHPWEIPACPWACLHINFAGPFQEMFMVLMDAFSKWLDVHVAVVPSCSAASLIRFLQNVLPHMGCWNRSSQTMVRPHQCGVQSIRKTELHSPHRQRPISPH